MKEELNYLDSRTLKEKEADNKIKKITSTSSAIQDNCSHPKKRWWIHGEHPKGYCIKNYCIDCDKIFKVKTIEVPELVQSRRLERRKKEHLK